MKTFIYAVGTYEFTDHEAWGEAWEAAKAKSAELHKGIFRQVINHRTGDDRQEFFVRGCFLNMKFYDESKLYIFGTED